VVAREAQAGLSRAQLDEIGSRIDYQRPVSAGAAKLHVAYDVQLGLSGMVVGVVKTQGSGDAGFDTAVAKAIKESKPFPPATARKLKLDYRAEYRMRIKTKERTRPPEDKREQEGAAEPAPQ
jgi:outer membrane biosynthesis protein TonB